MKKLLLMLLLSFNVTAAEPELINFELQDAKLPEVLKLFLTSVYKQQYVISSDLAKDTTPVNISVKNRNIAQAKEIFDHLVNEHNIHLKDVGGTYYLSKRKNSDHITIDTHSPVITSTPQLNPPTYTQPQQTNVPDLISSPPDVHIYKPINMQPEELLKLLRFASIRAEISAGYILYENKPNSEKFITDLLKEFDGYNSDLVIKATILEYQKNDKSETALDAALGIIKDTLTFGTVTSNLTASALTLAIPRWNLSAVLRNISNNDSFRVLSTPTLRVSHNKRASINVGNEVPVLSQLTQTQQGQPLQNIQYRPSGITLEVMPKIFTDIIELEILQTISDFIPTTNGVNNSPTLSQRRLSTTLKVKNGETILIGGLNQSRQDELRASFFGIPTGKQKGDLQTDLLLVLHVEEI